MIRRNLLKAILLFMTLTSIQNYSFAQSFKPLDMVTEAKANYVFEQINLFTTGDRLGKEIPSEVKNYSILKIDQKAIDQLLHSSKSSIDLVIPTTDRQNMVLELVQVELAPFSVLEAPANTTAKYQDGKHYRGIVKGQNNSLVAISVFNEEVMGFISQERAKGNLVLGRLDDNSGDHILYEDSDLMEHFNFECGTVDSMDPYEKEEIFNHSGVRALTDCVGMYFEVDYDIFLNKGSVANATNYVTGLFNQVSTLYANENINTNISQILVWSTPSPYNGSTSSAMLNQFTAYRNGFTGNIAMLLSYKASGGIAYVNTLCNNNPDYRMGFSSIQSSYSTVPTYSWSVEVVTHEFGHLIGSQHTHACVWNGNNTAIDGCYTTEGGCSNPGIPTGGGTIMSYCHLTSAGINFNNGFGAQPGNLIRSKVTAANCLSQCSGGGGGPTCTDGILNGQETGIDCGGPTCPPCSSGCSQNAGTLTILLDNYPGETTWNIKNSSGATLYSGGPYSSGGSTVSVSICIPNGCYTFNVFDSYGDGICCGYGQGSYNLVVNGSSVASGGQFGSSITHSFCANNTSGPSCTDGIQNGQETGVDCGGPTCPPCAPSCSDGIQNGQETGVDCGGPTCPPCAPSCSDGIKNGQETGVDCGGPTCPPCAPSCTDGIKNGQETGVDCGGPTCPPCVPSCTDGIKNGQETGVDCGGPTCPPCPSSCTDGIQNGQETGVDCGGPTCPPCNNGGGTTLGGYFFESGWDGWVDGGTDCFRYSGSRSYEGNYSIAIRDNTSTSKMTSPVYNLSSFNQVSVEFYFYSYSMESGEDFWLQYYNGSTWQTVASYVNGTNFSNNSFYTTTVTLNGSQYSMPSNAQFRFVCDASTDADIIYIDAVTITASSTGNLQEEIIISQLQSNIGISNDNGFKVYPNPTSNQLNIDVNLDFDDEDYTVLTLQMYDLMGRMVSKGHYDFAEGRFSHDLVNLNTGMYILILSNAEGEQLLAQKIQVIQQ